MAFGPQSIRLVTHLDVHTEEIEKACHTLQQVAQRKRTA
jgi:hypothetical protein